MRHLRAASRLHFVGRLTLSAVRASSTTESVRIVSPAHAVQDLSNIAARLKTRATASAAGELERIEQIAKVVEHKGWLQNGLVTAALARAYGEAGQLDVAIPLYRQALAAEDAAARNWRRPIFCLVMTGLLLWAAAVAAMLSRRAN